MPGPVNPESMLTMDEMARARDLAVSLYQSMLADLDFTEEGPDEQSELSAREKVLAVIAWRQAVAFEFTSRIVAQNGVGG
jgi:hypothetical protein